MQPASASFATSDQGSQKNGHIMLLFCWQFNYKLL